MTSARRAPALLLAAALLVLLLPPPAAAQPSGGVVLSGRVLRADGSPFSGAAVLLEEKTSLFQVLVEVFTVTVSAGTALLTCLDRETALSVCRTTRSVGVRTGPDGRWRAPFPGRSGEAALAVTETGGPRRGQTVLSTVVSERDPSVPDLREWLPRPSSGVRSGRVRFDYAPLPSETGDDPGYRVVLTPTRAGGPVGEVFAGSEGASVDARLLEDAPGTAVVEARAGVAGLDVVWYSAPVAYAAPAGRPLTRGRPCRVAVVGQPVVASPRCWTGDGRTDRGYPGPRPRRCTSRDAFDRTCRTPGVAAVVVDLGVPRALGLAVVRGCPGRCRLEGSLDRVRWEPLTDQLPEAFQESVELDRPRARYVRLTPDGPVEETVEDEIVLPTVEEPVPAREEPFERPSDLFDGLSPEPFPSGFPFDDAPPGADPFPSDGPSEGPVFPSPRPSDDTDPFPVFPLRAQAGTRVSPFATGNELSGVTELSLWEAAPSRTAPARSPAAGPEGVGPASAPPAVGLPGLLAALLVAAVGALWVADRRRSAPHR